MMLGDHNGVSTHRVLLAFDDGRVERWIVGCVICCSSYDPELMAMKMAIIVLVKNHNRKRSEPTLTTDGHEDPHS